MAVESRGSGAAPTAAADEVTTTAAWGRRRRGRGRSKQTPGADADNRRATLDDDGGAAGRQTEQEHIGLGVDQARNDAGFFFNFFFWMPLGKGSRRLEG